TGKNKMTINSDKEPILFIMSEDERLRLIHNLTAMPPKNKTRKYLMHGNKLNEAERIEYLNLD
ncbi:MAG: hypothetical protein ACC656_09945, partial [Candidatus Heimdallarchaeota archaeon]